MDGKFALTEAVDKKKGKPGQKIFGGYSLIQREGKFVRKSKTCEFLDFLDACNKCTTIKSLFTGLYCQIIAW